MIRNKELCIFKESCLFEMKGFISYKEMCLLSSKVMFQESFRSLYKELFGEMYCKEVEEELSENCIFHKR